jgi:hypothetical protein
MTPMSTPNTSCHIHFPAPKHCKNRPIKLSDAGEFIVYGQSSGLAALAFSLHRLTEVKKKKTWVDVELEPAAVVSQVDFPESGFVLPAVHHAPVSLWVLYIRVKTAPFTSGAQKVHLQVYEQPIEPPLPDGTPSVLVGDKTTFLLQMPEKSSLSVLNPPANYPLRFFANGNAAPGSSAVTATLSVTSGQVQAGLPTSSNGTIVGSLWYAPFSVSAGSGRQIDATDDLGDHANPATGISNS